jgi:hypothetical protein
MDLIIWIDIKLQYIYCVPWVILWFEIAKLSMEQLEVVKLYMEQPEMVKLFVKQRIHEFLLVDRNSMLCIHFEISVVF